MQINNVSLLFFRRTEPTLCKIPAHFLLERLSGKLCLTVIYFSEAMHRKAYDAYDGAERIARDSPPEWPMGILQNQSFTNRWTNCTIK